MVWHIPFEEEWKLLVAVILTLERPALLLTDSLQKLCGYTELLVATARFVQNSKANFLVV